MVFKILLNIDEVDLNALIPELSKKGDLLLDKSSLLLHVEDSAYNTYRSIRKVMKMNKISDFVITEVTQKKHVLPDDYMSVWCNNYIEKDLAKKLEIENQGMLQKVMDNIDRFRQEFLTMKEEIEKED